MIAAFFTTLLASATFIWAASIIFIITMAILLENEKEGWATTVFSIGIGLLLWNYMGSIWEFISMNPSATIGFIISYVVIGIIWSFIKWISHVKSVFNKFGEFKNKFLKTVGDIEENKGKFIIELAKLKFKDFNGYSAGYHVSESLEEMVTKITPLASEKKSTITAWISYWPVSLVATLLNNPFRRFFEWIYNNISGSYDRISNRLKKDLLK